MIRSNHRSKHFLLTCLLPLTLIGFGGCATPWNPIASQVANPPVSAPLVSQQPAPIKPYAPASQQFQAQTQTSAQGQLQPQSGIQLAGHQTPVAQASFGGNFGGHTCPPGGCPPTGCPPMTSMNTTMNTSMNHGTNACTAGCCGTQGPVYPTMPPLASFGLDPQEFLCDGGDQIPDARVRLDNKIIGVGLEDTVAKYETQNGQLHVTPSNRVCLYAPRFASVRKIAGAVTDELVAGPNAYIRPQGPNDLLARQPSSAVMLPLGPERQTRANGPDALRGRDLGVPIDTVNGPVLASETLALLTNISVISDGVLRDADKPWLAKGNLAAITWSLEQSVQVVVDEVVAQVATVDLAVEGITAYDLPGGRLRLIKVADRHSAQVGELVTFVLRVDNTGEGRLDNVVVTDNLTTRLEYVQDSQTCSKGVKFETEINEGGSLRLTWKFTDDFEVGEGAIIRFQCRVR